MINNVRQWYHYPIEMPLNIQVQGPATVGVDAVSMTYEVWDVLLNTHASFDNLPDAINEAMRLNALLDLTPDPRVTALVDAANAMAKALDPLHRQAFLTMTGGYGHLIDDAAIALREYRAALAAMKDGDT